MPIPSHFPSEASTMPRSGRQDQPAGRGGRERITITTARPGDVRVSITAGLFGVDPVVPRHSRWAFQRPAREGRGDSILTIETSDGGSPSSSSSEASDDASSLNVETSGSDGEAASAGAKDDATKSKKGKAPESCLKCEKQGGNACLKKKNARDDTCQKDKQDRGTKDKATASKNQKKKKKKAENPNKKEKDAPTREDADDTSAAESSEVTPKKVAKKHKKIKAKKPASPTKAEDDPKPTNTEQSAGETTDAGGASANATSGAEDTESGEAGGGGKDASAAAHGNGDESTNRARDTEATKEAATQNDGDGWTDSQDAIILSMKDGNETWAVIGRAIGRGKKEVQKRHKELLAKRGAGPSAASPAEATHDDADNDGGNKTAEAAKEKDEQTNNKDGDKKQKKKEKKAKKDKSRGDDPESPGPARHRYLSEQDPSSDRRIYGDHFPANSLSGKIQPDINFNERDCEVLVRLADENSRNKWLEMQAAFFNYTGRMVSIELLKHKIGRYIDGEGET